MYNPVYVNDYNAQLLGKSAWSYVTDTTHNILNAGASIPITSGAVDAIRTATGWFTYGKKADKASDSAIDAAAAAIKANKIKTAVIIGGVGAVGLYLILRKKK